MSQEQTSETLIAEMKRLAMAIEQLQKENDQLRERVSALELQAGQLTERVMRNGGCSSCSI